MVFNNDFEPSPSLVLFPMLPLVNQPQNPGLLIPLTVLKRNTPPLSFSSPCCSRTIQLDTAQKESRFVQRPLILPEEYQAGLKPTTMKSHKKSNSRPTRSSSELSRRRMTIWTRGPLRNANYQPYVVSTKIVQPTMQKSPFMLMFQNMTTVLKSPSSRKGLTMIFKLPQHTS